MNATFTCFRAAVRLTYLPSRQKMSWYPIIQATSEEHARRKAVEVYEMRGNVTAEVIGIIPLHGAVVHSHEGLDTGEMITTGKATTPDAAPTKTSNETGASGRQ